MTHQRHGGCQSSTCQWINCFTRVCHRAAVGGTIYCSKHLRVYRTIGGGMGERIEEARRFLASLRGATR